MIKDIDVQEKDIDSIGIDTLSIMEEMGFRKDFSWENRFITQETINYKGHEVFISTVDLGLNHAFGGEKPLYYETMIFVDGDSSFMDRYSTEEEAIEGHKNILNKFKSNEIVIDSINGDFIIEL